MSWNIISLLIVLCGDDKSCLSQAIMENPKTAKQATVIVHAVNERDRLISQTSNLSQYAQPMFDCIVKQKEIPVRNAYNEKDCWHKIIVLGEENRIKRVKK